MLQTKTTLNGDNKEFNGGGTNFTLKNTNGTGNFNNGNIKIISGSN